jgi:Bacterial type II/III secretion system short domain
MRRTFKQLAWTMIAMAGLAVAQDPNKVVQKMIEVKYADPDKVALLLRGARFEMSYDKSMRVLIARGTEQTVAEIEAMVKKLDTAPPNIELTVYLVSGAADSKTARTTDEVPPELTSTVKQLHGLFAYKSYRVQQSFVLRARDGHEGRDSGTLPGSSSEYNFSFRSATVSQGTPRIVHIDNLQFSVRVPTSFRDKDGHVISDSSSISTDLDAGEGQKIVVGKSSIHGSDDAMILVVTAKVVE